MEPATAPRPDMAPELTPEEEQVSGPEAAAVGVSGPPRPTPASASRVPALCSHGAAAPPLPCPARRPPSPATAPQAATPSSGDPRDPAPVPAASFAEAYRPQTVPSAPHPLFKGQSSLDPGAFFPRFAEPLLAPGPSTPL